MQVGPRELNETSEVSMVGIYCITLYFALCFYLFIGSLSNFHTTDRLDTDLDRQQKSVFYMRYGA